MEYKLNSQSSIKIISNKIIYIDPYKIKDKLNDADYIFITHNHYDHYDKKSINNIINNNTKIIIPDSMIKDVLGYFNNENIYTVIPSSLYNIDGLEFTTIPSYNINKEYHPKKNNWVGYNLNIENKHLYITGDTDLIEESKLVKCDILFIPIGGTYTMNYEEAANLTNIINPSIVIPTHYKTIVGSIEDAKKFKSLVNCQCEIIKEDDIYE